LQTEKKIFFHVKGTVKDFGTTVTKYMSAVEEKFLLLLLMFLQKLEGQEINNFAQENSGAYI
jgi:hypothetical protein